MSDDIKDNARDDFLIGSLDITSTLGLEPCQEANCELPAIQDTSKCWQHLTNDERENIRKNVQDNRSKLRGIKLPFADLSNLDLSEADLGRAILPGAILSNCQLSRATLIKAFLPNSNLEGANLSKARCNSINLSESVADKAIFEGAVLASCYA